MKLVLLLMIITMVHATASTSAQKISLYKTNASLKSIIKEIRSQTGYNFIYTDGALKESKPININVNQVSLEEALNEVFQGQPLTFSINKNTVVVKTVDLAAKSINQITVKGKVLDEAGLPLIGATVKIKGHATGTTTDINGEFTINQVGETDVLVISYTGFATQEIVPGTRDFVTITLKEENKELSEVVVVGYGVQKKVNLTGSLSVLDMKERENRPITNASQALHGVSGLWVNQAGGKPGQDVGTIRIRGVGTIGATGKNDPLVLVDGIEYNLNEINPAFIETITVLKDASAAIYGTRAANGVILVTTKTGKKGKNEVNYSYSYGTQDATFLPDVLWDPIQYMQLKNQALINEGKSAASVDYSQAQIDEYRNGMSTDPYSYPNVNWFDLVLKTGKLQQHNLRFSGGNDKILYSIGLGYMDQDGILIDANHANRYTLNANVSANITDKLRVGTNLTGNYRTFTQPAFGGGDASSYYFTRLTRVLPIFTPYTADGRYGSTVFATPGRNTIENPIMLLKEGSNYNTPQRILAKVFADYKLPFNLTYNINFGVDKLDGYARSFLPYLVSYNPKTGAPNNYNINPAANNYDENNLNLSFYQTLTWDRDFTDKHHVTAMLGTSYNKEDISSFNGHMEGYLDNTLTDLAAGSTLPTATGRVTKTVLASYFGRFNYDYKEKYLIDATLRFDGSSRFARENRWGVFPAVSAAWRIDQESFFDNVPFIDLLKVRASWGKLGNENAVPLHSFINTVDLGVDYTFKDNVFAGSASTTFNDPDIKWETTTTSNIGFDADAWNGKLGFTFDLFKRRTSDILRAVALPQQVGLGGGIKNIGTVDNTGYEIGLSHRGKAGQFTYGISGQVSYVKNKVVDLKGETTISTRRIIREGDAIESYYLYKAIGIYQNQEEINSTPNLGVGVRPGYIKYADLSGPNGVPDGKITGDDRIIAGSTIPKYNYGFTLNAGFKGFSMNAFFQGVQGVDLYPTVNLATPFNNGAGVTREWLTDAWTPSNPNARLPIVTTATGATQNYQPSTFWLKDGSYMRLKNIQLMYDFPTKWISKIAVNKLSLFINGENLVTFSKYKDFDPEKSITGDNLYEYPTLKTYSFGINITP
ncbi:MAG: TonB-dependent receptor [Sphingobacteriaceae bacterium]